jgi:hypothetical protein
MEIVAPPSPRDACGTSMTLDASGGDKLIRNPARLSTGS